MKENVLTLVKILVICTSVRTFLNSMVCAVCTAELDMGHF